MGHGLISAGGLTRSRRWAVLGAAPAILLVSAFAFGAYRPLPSLVLFAATSACLVLALTRDRARAELAGLQSVIPVGVLFSAVIGAALWSLTPWTPAGPAAPWAWVEAGIGGGGAATLNASATALEIIRLLGLASLFLMGCILGATSSRARSALGIILVLGVLYAGVALLTFLSGAQVRHHPGRLLGGFYSANTAATLLAMLSLLAAAWVLRTWRHGGGQALPTRIAALSPPLAALALFGACLLLTASRAGILAAGLAMAVLLALEAVQNPRSRRAAAILAGGLVLVGASLLATGSASFADRYQTAEADAAYRLVMLRAHWPVFLEAPVFGQGLGSFAQINARIVTPETFGPLTDTVVLHNTYLQWLEEAGLAGAAPMFLLIGWILAVTIRGAAQSRQNRTLLTALLLASAVALAQAAVDVSLHVPTITGLWSLLLGLGFALSQVRRSAADA